MTTKEHGYCRSRQNSSINHSHSDNNSNHFFNLNLNQNHKCSNGILSPVQSYSKTNNDKRSATFGTIGYTVTDMKNQETGKSWKKSKKYSSLQNLCIEAEEEKGNLKINDKTSVKKSSTLSLHIAAYENSIEIRSNENLNLSKESKPVDSLTKSGINQNLFEFPRQMEGNTVTPIPEVQQFSTSQRLFSPNQGQPQQQRRHPYGPRHFRRRQEAPNAAVSNLPGPQRMDRSNNRRNGGSNAETTQELYGAPVEHDGGNQQPQQNGERSQQQQPRQQQQHGGGRQQQQHHQNQRRQQNQNGGRQQQQQQDHQHDGGRQQQPKDGGRQNERQNRRGGGGYQRNNYRNNNPHYRNNHQRPVPASGFDHLIKSRKDHAGIEMSGNIHDCLICCQPSDVFGVGECRHPVCIECCIRMRILGNSESCPQCRSPITLLYFVQSPESWDSFTIPSGEITHADSAKYNIRFTTDYTVKCYDSYLAHSCQICAEKGDKIEFPTFGALRHHTAQTHERTFCPICIEHLNILSKDRKAYLKTELDNHMNGKSNEISGQKGHPKCLYCPERFFDDDHLYRHLRQEHYFCQICENDGGKNIFYSKIEALYSHYKQMHHPCTEPDCLRMGIAFRTDVELGVHKATEHGGGARNVNIDFQFSGRNLGNRIHRNNAQNERDYPAPIVRQERLSVVPSEAPPPSLPSRIVPSAQAQQTQIVRSRFDQSNTRDFPILNPSAPASSTVQMANWRQEVQNMRRPQPSPQMPIQISSGEQFPTLGGGGNSARVAPTSSAEPFPSLGVKSKNNNTAANSVWGKGKPIQLFKANNTPAPKPKPPETPRRQFIPLPEIWPEGMRERVEAKMQGLPDPGPSQPETVDPLFRVEAAKKEKRKAAKKKSKTVPVSAFANREVQDNFVQPSKFDALAEPDESKNSKKNKVNKINYSVASDNTVKIEPVAPTLRSVADSIGEKNSKSPTSSEHTSKENGTLSPPSSSSNEVTDFPALGGTASLLPSLTDIASGLTSIWKGRTNPASAPPPTSSSSTTSTKQTAWSTGPPPGFS